MCVVLGRWDSGRGMLKKVGRSMVKACKRSEYPTESQNSGNNPVCSTPSSKRCWISFGKRHADGIRDGALQHVFDSRIQAPNLKHAKKTETEYWNEKQRKNNSGPPRVVQELSPTWLSCARFARRHDRGMMAVMMTTGVIAVARYRVIRRSVVVLVVVVVIILPV